MLWTALSFLLAINFKMPTIFGILNKTAVSRTAKSPATEWLTHSGEIFGREADWSVDDTSRQRVKEAIEIEMMSDAYLGVG